MKRLNRRQRKFQALTRPWRDRLYGVALRCSDGTAMAEDWVQETLLRAWRNFDDLQDQQLVYAWLLKILDHVIADDRRREVRRNHLAPVILTDDAQLAKHHSALPGPFENTLKQQTNDQLIEAIRSLPEEFSKVIILRDLEGLSYREIATILSIPQGTVMSRLSRGRRLLSRQLSKEQGKEQATNTPSNTLGMTK